MSQIMLVGPAALKVRSSMSTCKHLDIFPALFVYMTYLSVFLFFTSILFDWMICWWTPRHTRRPVSTLLLWAQKHSTTPLPPPTTPPSPPPQHLLPPMERQVRYSNIISLVCLSHSLSQLISCKWVNKCYSCSYRPARSISYPDATHCANCCDVTWNPNPSNNTKY